MIRWYFKLCFVFFGEKACSIKWKNAISGFPVSPGSAEALVRCGGKIKYILIAYFLGNIYAKNCRNRTVYVKNIASCKGGTLFLRHNVVKRLILLPLICLLRRFVNETQQQSSVLYNRLNEQWLFVQHGCQTGCQTLLTTGLTMFTRYSRLSNRLYNRLYRVNGVLK